MSWPIRFVLPMSVGAILMSLSTIVVALNAQLPRGLDLSPQASAAAAHGAAHVHAGRNEHARARQDETVPARH